MDAAGIAIAPFCKAPEENEMVVLEESVHRCAIRDIADSLGRPQAEVAILYRELFVDLTARATVTTYLPVLVTRRIRERYRNLTKQ